MLAAEPRTSGTAQPLKDVPASAWVALCLGTACVFADMYTTQSILPVLGRAFGLSPAAAGMPVAAPRFRELIVHAVNDRDYANRVISTTTSRSVAPCPE